MDAKLVVVGGEAQAGEYPLKLPVIIGRSRGVDLKLAHPLVSRKHCELYEENNQLVVRDLGSLNGTFIGGSRITGATIIPPGGKVTIGAVTFQAVYGDMPVEDNANSLDFLATPPVAAPLEQTLEFSDMDSPETEFLPSEQPAPSSDDDDMSDFFANLK